MANELVSRAEARASLVAALTAGCPSAQGVLSSLPDNPQISPFLSVESAGAFVQWEPAIYNQFRFIIGVYINRIDPDDTEDILDQLALEIAQTIGGWHNGEFFQMSDADYLPADVWPGQWRFEFFFVQVDWE